MPKNKSQAQKKFEQTVTEMAKNKDAATDKKKAVLKSGIKNMGKNYKDGFTDMMKTSANMIFGLAGNLIQGKSPLKDLANQSLQYGKREMGRIISTVKGFFNDPKWYEYHGEQVSFAANELRPFSPKNTLSLQDYSYRTSPGPGVTHVIQNNVRWGDVFDTEAFSLATSEAYRIIRENLRSNLTYDITHFRNYLKSVMSLIAITKTLEKTLGWFTATRSDIPELHDALTHVTSNPEESGKVAMVPIACIENEDRYAATLNAFNVLKNYCAQLAVPRRLVEYISWWVGGTFIDQSQPNPQIYTNMLRYAPIYGYDINGDFDLLGEFDIATCSIYDIINQAKGILDSNGVINADLIKSELYGYFGLVAPENYSPVALCDYEFFNVLINSYNYSEDTFDGIAPIKNLFADDYVRVDILPEVDKAHALGAILALGRRYGIAVPFRVQSQAAYISHPSATPVVNNAQGITNWTGSITLYNASSQDYFLQNTGSSYTKDEFQVLINTSQKGFNASYNNKFNTSALTGFTVTSATAVTARAVTLSHSVRNPVGICLGKSSTGYWILQLTGSTGNLYYGCSSPTVRDGSLMSMSWPTTWQFSQTTDEQGYAIYQLKIVNGSTVTISGSTQQNEWINMFTVGSEIYHPGILDHLNVIGTVTTNKLAYTISCHDVAALFCEMVDYHMPTIVKSQTVVKNSTDGQTVTFKDMTKLLKECYIPMSVDYDNIKYIIYHMLLGLFSIN